MTAISHVELISLKLQNSEESLGMWPLSLVLQFLKEIRLDGHQADGSTHLCLFLTLQLHIKGGKKGISAIYFLYIYFYFLEGLSLFRKVSLQTSMGNGANCKKADSAATLLLATLRVLPFLKVFPQAKGWSVCCEGL